MGSGPTTFTIRGMAYDEAERLDIIAECEAGRSIEVNFYFGSENGQTNDRYYRGWSGPCMPNPYSPSIYGYSFGFITRFPYVYDAATDLRVT
jgi:hypothetical protein